MGKLLLGIDIGTTSVKTVLVDGTTGELIKSQSRETQATKNTTVPGGNEQDVSKILTALQFCLSTLPKEKLLNVHKIGIAGQMHGIVLWKSGASWSRNSYGRFELSSNNVSSLYTWQDTRAGPDFLSSLPRPDSHLGLSTGYGCVTLLWLKENQGSCLENYDCAGTVQDMVVSMLTDSKRPVTSTHNAASWGYYNAVSKQWNSDILKQQGLKEELLPDVKEAGEEAGKLCCNWYEIPENTPVGVAMGDLQCSIRARLSKRSDAVLNISTSAQLAFEMHDGFEPSVKKEELTSTVDYLPYFGSRYVAVAASLSGGNVMAAFVRTLQQWTHELGVSVPQAKIWTTLLSQTPRETDLSVVPTLFGERHSPSVRAKVDNITVDNTSLASVFSAICKGVVCNLHSMMPRHVLLAAAVKRIVGSGSVLARNHLVRQYVEGIFQLPLVISSDTQADAAVGAAYAVGNFYAN